MITIDDLRDPLLKSGFKHVHYGDNTGAASDRATFHAERRAGWRNGAGSFNGPRRATAEEAAQDAANYLNGRAIMDAIPTGPTGVKMPPTLADLRVLATEAATHRRTRRRGKRGRKTRRGKRQRVYALARANGRCECGCGVEYEFGLDVHHVRLDAECRREGILWDSPENVLAVRPDCHRRAHSSKIERMSMFKAIDAIERHG